MPATCFIRQRCFCPGSRAGPSKIW
jgi:hypothetical protein